MTAGFITNAAVGVRPMAAFGSTALDPDHPRLADLRQVYDGVAFEQI